MTKYQTRPGDVVDAILLEVGPEGEIPEGIRPSTRNRGHYEFKPDPERESWAPISEGEWLIFENGRYHTMKSRDFHFLYVEVGKERVDGAVRIPGFKAPLPQAEKPLDKHEKALANAQAKEAKAAKAKASKQKSKAPQKGTKEEK